MSGTENFPGGSLIGVLGSGTMGRGIARIAAGAGHRVVLNDVSDEALESARSEMSRFLARDVEKGRLDTAAAAAIEDRIQYDSDVSGMGDAVLVIEAIIEDRDAKVALLRQVEAIVSADTVFATNTSSLSVTAIAAGLERPRQVAGMHFFNPAPVMPLVEIVAGADSSPEVLDALTALASAWGKTPVRATSTPGFIVNRVARPFYGEALRMVEENLASPAEVDGIVMGAGGFRMGPFALMDLVGLDVNLAVSKSVYSQTFHDPRFAPNQIQQQLVDAGRLGRKTGRGFYDYDAAELAPEARVVPADGTVDSVIVHGSGGELAGLVARIAASGVKVTTGFGPAAGIAAGTTLLWPSDGRPVSTIDPLIPELTVVAMDEVLDWSTASAVAIAGSDESALGTAAAMLGTAGLEARRVGDSPGLVLLRIMAQLASVAADTVLRGIATADDIDTAMRLGTNYPFGPLEWANRFGTARVVEVLDHIADFYGEQRYRPSPLLRRVADTGAKIGEGP